MKHGASKWIPFILIFAIQNITATANTDSTKTAKPSISWEAFGDFFWAYDNNKPTGENRQPFLYNHNRHASVDLNLAYFKLGISHARYRANLSVQTGTYVYDNYASDHDLLRYFQEANAGIAINKKKNLWLDAGIFASHIGFESAISAENINLSRSLLAENSPYYMAGAKLSFEPNPSWKMSASILNGWQRIQPIAGNSLPALGTQITYTKNQKFLFNWSSFTGTIDPDSSRRMRYFHNLYGQWKIGEKILLIAGLDFGIQQTGKSSASYHTWFSPIAVAQYRLSERIKIGSRIERYADINNAHIAPINNQGFDCSGYSLNLDFAPNPSILLRAEIRHLQSSTAIFKNDEKWQTGNTFALASVVFKIGKK
ncbi:MAG: porin [Bacteroidia bacterium]